ncbi:D-alanyl-D-alanine carboxypeptidase [Altericista sp. CCNU0014]|uniref:D-alanyl-D-alanine carboxypeptidase n=1 Tax=Altericista sp. CCNU0014 TaxID=3082949 RepID=UPI00384D82A3
MFIEFFSSSLLGLWLKTARIAEPPLQLRSASLHRFALQPADARRDRLVEAYLNTLAQQGIVSERQGLWLQTDSALLVDRQGQQLQTPASLTKVATTLAALKTWGPTHQFKTQIWTTGAVKDGVLAGDLHIQGDGDPLLVTSEAIAIAQQLNALGIRKVTGQLIVSGAFLFNLDPNLQTAGEQLKAVWNSGTTKSEVEIVGTVASEITQENGAEKPLISHASLPLTDILKMMNVYSNNRIAETLTDRLGGPDVLQQIAIETGRVAPQEILLENGSGLGQDNKLSPRAVVGLFQAIQAELQAQQLSLGDVFPVMGPDRGTVEERKMPAATVVKTGTLWNTSGLAGVLQTQRYGPVWFAVMNSGNDFTDGFRKEQDGFLKRLAQHWGEGVALAQPAGIQRDPVAVQRLKVIDRLMQDDFWLQ